MVKRLLLLVLLVGCTAQRELPRLAEGWQYTLTTPRNTPPDESATWSDEVETDHQRDMWMRARLPSDLPAESEIVFRAFVDELELYVEQTPIYSFRDASLGGRLTIHAVPLPRQSASRFLYIRVPRAPEERRLGDAPVLATRATLPFALDIAAAGPMREDAADIFLALVMTIVGAIAIGASAMRTRGDSRALRWFGLFTLLYGARLGIDTQLPTLFGVRLLTVDFIESFITYVIPIPGWLLAERLIGPGWRSSLRRQVFVFAAFAPIGIVSDIVTGDPGSLGVVNNVLVIVGGANILANLFYIRERATLELRIVLAGSLLFLLFAIHNNLVGLGALPWNDSNETIGFVLFTVSLGFAAFRGFVRSEREQIALQEELRMAREIQQSILPSSMPEMAELRFCARYDPASSVAGDLYDFLRVDEHRVGVLVADVSGHGVPAALVASMVKIAVSVQSRMAHDPAAMMQELDRMLRGEVRRAFVTATYLWFDTAQRCIVASNAGHPPPLLMRDEDFVELGAQGVVLGRFPKARYTSTTTELRAGDRIVAFTDGVVEARNARGEQFGDARLKEALLRYRDDDTPRVADAIVDEVRRWRGNDEDADDLTLVVIDQGGVPSSC